LLTAAVALVFAFGWLINGWRLNSKHADAMQAQAEMLMETMKDQAEKSRLANERLRLRETHLLQELTQARRDAAILSEEIDNADVVTITERVEVPADCPPVPRCAVVDSLQYRELYNRGAAGAVPDSGTGDVPVPQP
jgi:hypothetical protein